jgi:hypothetical protein
MVTLFLKVNKRRGAAVRIFVIGALLGIGSCSIFSPRPSEAPSPNGPGPSDPFHFQSILTGTNQSFGKPQYEDLFTDDFSYSDINSGSWGKGDLIQRLRQIILTGDSAQVGWVPGSTAPLNQGNTIYITGIKYFVYLHGDMTAVYSGISDFKVIRNPVGDNEWHIESWRDVSSITGKSFFAPIQ